MAANQLTEEGLLFIEQTLRHLLPGVSDFDFNEKYWKPSRQAIKRACDQAKASKKRVDWLQLFFYASLLLCSLRLLLLVADYLLLCSDYCWLLLLVFRLLLITYCCVKITVVDCLLLCVYNQIWKIQSNTSIGYKANSACLTITTV